MVGSLFSLTQIHTLFSLFLSLSLFFHCVCVYSETIVLSGTDLEDDLDFLFDSLHFLEISIADCLGNNDDEKQKIIKKVQCDFCSHCCNDTICLDHNTKEPFDWLSFI